jgi:hypothetical protein
MEALVGKTRGVAVGSAVTVTVGEGSAIDVEVTTPAFVKVGRGISVGSEPVAGVDDTMRTAVDVNEICIGEGCVTPLDVDTGGMASGVTLERNKKKRINKKIATINLKTS